MSKPTTQPVMVMGLPITRKVWLLAQVYFLQSGNDMLLIPYVAPLAPTLRSKGLGHKADKVPVNWCVF